MKPPIRALFAVVLTAAACALAALIPDASGVPTLAQVVDEVAGPEAMPLPHLDPAVTHLGAFEQRVGEHPRSANSHYMLATLQARHARESGDERYYIAAERALRRALVLRREYAEAQLALARVLNSQHRFAAGAELATALIQQWPERTGARAVLFDALIGRGDYEEADTLLDEITSTYAGPAVLARQADLAEIHGRDGEALALLLSAARAAKARYVPRSEMAWYLFRLAEFHLRRGRHQEALIAADTALRLEPSDLRAQVTRARLLAADGSIGEAIESYESIVTRLPHPEHLAALADLYRHEGRVLEAQAAFAAALEVGRTGGTAEDRPMARLLADRGLSPSEAVRRARRDLETRRDVEAYDTLAWALHAAGEHVEAAKASAMALRFGTSRADFHLHAAAIADALGQPEQARRHQDAAHDINPYARLPLTTLRSSNG